MKLFVKRFTSEYQELLEGLNLVRIWHTGLLKAYVLDLNARMNATSKRDNFAKKCIFLGEKNKSWWWSPCLRSQTFEDTGIITSAKGIEIDGPERESGRVSPQRA